MRIYEKTIRVSGACCGMSDKQLDLIIDRCDEILDDEPIEDAAITIRKEFPNLTVEVD